MNDSLHPLLEKLRPAFKHSLGFTPEWDFAGWQAAARALYRDAVPGWQETAVAELTDTVSRPTGGERRTYRLDFSHGDSAEAIMLVPESAGSSPAPAILLFHDHGGGFACGWDKMISPEGTKRAVHSAESSAWIERYYGGRFFGDHLCDQGFIVLCADALGWGDRALPDGPSGQQRLAANAMQFGFNPAGLVAAEDAQTLRWLVALPEVDTSKLTAAGFSFGGYRAWQLAALCDQIRATAALGWMCTRAGAMVPGTGMLLGQSAFYMLHPSLGGKLDFPDMAGAGAPRPMFMRVGDHDPIFPRQSVCDAFEQLRAIWEAAGHPENLDVELFNGPHDCPRAVQEQAAAFLKSAIG